MRRTRSRRIQLTMALGLLALFAMPAQGELYEWTDEHGRTHYSNEPRPGADAVGLKPLELEPADSPNETPTDAARRERLKRQDLERWVDSEQAKPEAGKGREWIGPDGTADLRHAPAVEDAAIEHDKECQRRTGMSCAQLEAWKKSQRDDCGAHASGDDCSKSHGEEKEPAAAAKAPGADRFSDYEDRQRAKQAEKDRRAAERHRDSVLHRRRQ